MSDRDTIAALGAGRQLGLLAEAAHAGRGPALAVGLALLVLGAVDALAQAGLPRVTAALVTPIFSKSPARENLPPMTPMEPVMVAGCAKIRVAGVAM